MSFGGALLTKAGSCPVSGVAWGRSDDSTPASRTSRITLPHMGWNDVKPRRVNVFRELDRVRAFISCTPTSSRARRQICLLSPTTVGILRQGQHGNVFGVRFHPEKSHQWGIQFLKNFAQILIC